MPAADSNKLGEHVSAQPSDLPETGGSSSSGVKPSSAPPPSSSGVKPSTAPLGDRSVVEHQPLVKVVEGEAGAVPESPIRSVAEVPEEGGSLVDVHSSEDDAEEAAKSLNHSLTHYPKSRH